MHIDQQDYVTRCLKALGAPKWDAVAKGSKVSVHNISKLAYGMIGSPRYVTLRPLVRYFAKNPVAGVEGRLIR